eukprot:6988484-Prymnesium_polylepis.1
MERMSWRTYAIAIGGRDCVDPRALPSLVWIVSAGAVTWVLVSGPGRPLTGSRQPLLKRNGQRQHRRTKRPTCSYILYSYSCVHGTLNGQSSLREK